MNLVFVIVNSLIRYQVLVSKKWGFRTIPNTTEKKRETTAELALFTCIVFKTKMYCISLAQIHIFIYLSYNNSFNKSLYID